MGSGSRAGVGGLHYFGVRRLKLRARAVCKGGQQTAAHENQREAQRKHPFGQRKLFFSPCCFARFLRIFHALLWVRVRGRVHSRCLAIKKSRIRTPPVTAVLNAAELSSGFLAFPSGECQHKRLKLCVPGSRQVCQSFQFCGMFPAAGTILHSPGCKRCHSVAGR